jgi:hypothetical protein
MNAVRDHHSRALASPRCESLRAAAWRLYRVHPVFRGAVDFALIGAVVSFCLFGLPTLDLELPWLAGPAATGDTPSQADRQEMRPAPTHLPFTIRVPTSWNPASGQCHPRLSCGTPRSRCRRHGSRGSGPRARHA